jgi:hypothetical protein
MKFQIPALALLVLIAGCSSAPTTRDLTSNAPYSPDMVRNAVKDGALMMEVIGAPTEFTGARAIADAMAMPPHFKGILLAGEPPTGPGTKSTRLVLGFNLSPRIDPAYLCENAAAIRPRRGNTLDVLAVFCVGERAISSGRIEGPSYSSIELKDFRAQMAIFLGQVMPSGPRP